MKKAIYTTTILLMIALIPSAIFAANTNPPLTDQRQDVIEENILAGLTHPSIEVQGGYIQLIIDLKKVYPEYNFDYAIIPLMDRLKGSDDAPIRIFAALALYEFEDSDKGKFAIAQTAKHDSNKRLRKHCSNLVRNWNKRVDRPNYTAQIIFPF